MKPFAFVSALAIALASAAAVPGHAAGSFDVKLAPDKQAIHVLNRLTYGPRRIELEAIRRLGIEAWIRQQLTPGQLPEPPALVARLKSLKSLELPTWQLFETYQPPQPRVRAVLMPNISQLLPPDSMRKLTSGTLEERRAVMEALTPEHREQVFTVISPNMLEGLPDLKRQAERARQIQNEIRNRDMQEQMRKLRPPLAELLTPAQARDLQLGTTDEKMSVLTSLDADTRTLVFRSLPPQSVPDAFRREALAAMNPRQAVIAELIEARLQRAVYSPRQLEEVLVDFWFNHFNVFSGKGQTGMLLTSYERDAIRPHVLGRFRDMLLATARHPAMLFYLDNYQSRATPETLAAPAGFIQVTPVLLGGAARPGLNENFGRELMELHSLGAGGGYTQDDVVNVARAFTGWTIFDPGRFGEFQFNPAMHDRGEKVILGHSFPRGGGVDEGVEVIDLLATHPSTAQFIARKLAQRFVADNPPKPLVDRMAATFAKTGGDLRAVMETLLLSREFLSEGAWHAKTKSPLEMVVSALRALNAEVADTTALAQRLSDMGQPLYGKPEPTGYPETGEVWSGAAGLVARMSFANALTAGAISGVKVDVDAVAARGTHAAIADLLGPDPAPGTVAALESGANGAPTPAVLAAVLVASPEFQRR